MDTEQKAKAYDEALKVARYIHDVTPSSSIAIAVCEQIFPEFKKESEDERIGKALIDYFRWNPNGQLLNEFSNREVFAWLEKQGIEKLTVKPKFKVGDWIIYSNEEVHLITGFDDNGYFVDKECYIPFNCEGNMRLWTVDDAKDGDVLTNGDFPCIFKRCDGNGCLYVYCGINADNNFSILSEDSENVWDDYSKQYFPATKEQRDTLFAKMKESGYEWLEETKELKKQGEQKPWSEEDENMIDNIIFELEENQENINGVGYKIDWLKSLKQRMGG